MKEKLDFIEARLQSLIEGSLTLLTPKGNPQQTLAHQLVQTMQENLETKPDGRVVAPNQYQVQVHPSRAQYWHAHPGILDNLSSILEQAGHEAGFEFTGIPTINLVLDPALKPQEIRVVASSNRIKLDETAYLPSDPVNQPASTTEGIPPNAFLIVDGEQNFPLRLPVVNIGRRLDNHLVVDDPRVSRGHAQLRAIKGHYTIFDLNSTGGTFVNNQRVSQHKLNPGDVISLAGVPLNYGQDLKTPLSDTNNFSPSPENYTSLPDSGSKKPPASP